MALATLIRLVGSEWSAEEEKKRRRRREEKKRREEEEEENLKGFPSEAP